MAVFEKSALFLGYSFPDRWPTQFHISMKYFEEKKATTVACFCYCVTDGDGQNVKNAIVDDKCAMCSLSSVLMNEAKLFIHVLTDAISS